MGLKAKAIAVFFFGISETCSPRQIDSGRVIDIQLCIDDHSAVPCIDISSALAVENCHRDIFDSLWEVSESEPEAVGNDQDFVNGLWGTSDVVEPSEAVGETKAPSSNSSSCDDWAADLWQVDSPMTFVRELQGSIDFREQVCFVTKGRTRKMVSKAMD